MMSEPSTDIESDAPTSQIMACPDCGGTSFNWILEQVQNGTVHRSDDGRWYEEGMKMGEVVGSDVEENGVYCRGCDVVKDREDLVPLEEVEDQ